MRNWILKHIGWAFLIAATGLTGEAQTFSVIYTFTGGNDGSTPFGGLVIDGQLMYGTTASGGAHRAGTVFQLNTKSHVESPLHAFLGGRSDGAEPLAGLLRDRNGDLYGTTYGGGAHFYGTVFEFPAAGGYKVLHSFAGPPSEGKGPTGTLVIDDAGNLYGTTYAGGESTGYGTVFEITADGTYETGQSFSPDGALPRAGLVIQGGNLYGTTSGGGARQYGGTVFQVGVTSALYTFTGGADGSHPLDSLIDDGQGNLYGTTTGGGDGAFGLGHGVIFEVDAGTGAESVLHTFSGPDGSSPAGSLVRDSQGNFYGTTMLGGADNYGTVFELTAGGTLQTLYSFAGGDDGARPFAGLTLDSTGNLWGATTQGGAEPAPAGHGTIFKVTVTN
ncbi:MAG: choice-of-anchor tandem repeat GloVer-containing protein [Bryobacteraceae bacterium]